MSKIIEDLNQEIEDSIEVLSRTSDPEKAQQIADTIKQLIAAKQIEVETSIKVEEASRETGMIDIERERLEADTKMKRKMYWKEIGMLTLQTVSLVGNLYTDNRWMTRGFEFEEKGTISDPVFRSLTQRFNRQR